MLVRVSDYFEQYIQSGTPFKKIVNTLGSLIKSLRLKPNLTSR